MPDGYGLSLSILSFPPGPLTVLKPPHWQTYISGSLRVTNGASAYISLCWSSTLPPTLSVPLLCYQSQCCSLPSFGLECCMSAFIWIVVLLLLFISSSFIRDVTYHQFGGISPRVPVLSYMDLIVERKWQVQQVLKEDLLTKSEKLSIAALFRTYFKVQLLLITRWLHFYFQVCSGVPNLILQLVHYSEVHFVHTKHSFLIASPSQWIANRR